MLTNAQAEDIIRPNIARLCEMTQQQLIALVLQLGGEISRIRQEASGQNLSDAQHALFSTEQIMRFVEPALELARHANH